MRYNTTHMNILSFQGRTAEPRMNPDGVRPARLRSMLQYSNPISDCSAMYEPDKKP